VGFGGQEWTMSVLFNGSAALGELADHFNAKDLFVKNNPCGDSD